MADEWKYVDLPGYLVGKPAKWDEDKKEWVAYTGVNDVTVTNPPEPVDVQEISGTVDIGNLPEPVDVHKVEVTNQRDPVTDYPDASALTELQAMKADIAETKQQNAEILERLDGVFDTQVIGSNVEDGIPVKSIGNSVKFKSESFNFDLLKKSERQTQRIVPPDGKRWRIKLLGIDILPAIGDVGTNRVWIRYGGNQAQNQILSVNSKEGGRIIIQGNVVTSGVVDEGPKEEVTQSMALSLLLAQDTDFQIECSNGGDETLRRASVTMVYEEEK